MTQTEDRKSHMAQLANQIGNKFRGTFSRTEPELDESARRDRPGRLTGSYSVVLNTGDVVRMVRGRSHSDDKHGIYGLNDFARRMYLIWTAAADGDPFADCQLVQTEALLKDTDHQLRQMAGELNEQVRKMNVSHVFGAERPQLHMETPNSVKPIRLKFRYGQYGAIAVRLLKQTDDILMMVLNLRHMMVVTADAANQHRRQVQRLNRVVLSDGAFWRRTGVTRQDLKSGNRAARSAVEKLAQSGWLNMELYGTVEGACEFFGEYAVVPEYGPRSASQPEPDPQAVEEAIGDGVNTGPEDLKP